MSKRTTRSLLGTAAVDGEPRKVLPRQLNIKPNGHANKGQVKNITNILLSVIGGLLLFFGTISVNILSRLYDKVETMGQEQAVLKSEQANTKSELSSVRNDVDQLKPLLTSLSRLYGKPEDDEQFKPRSR